jgi:hypothetical protein
MKMYTSPSGVDGVKVHWSVFLKQHLHEIVYFCICMRYCEADAETIDWSVYSRSKETFARDWRVLPSVFRQTGWNRETVNFVEEIFRQGRKVL